ncbi:MAG: hypothetical protein KC910_17590, partial [Candidatus Eremiobacteraeota bacterium]|nr:hypothetical protein [Candidatus Eremiobacteraeota bacterium]
MLTVSDYVIAERSLLDPEQVILKNLYHNTELETGPEVWQVLANLDSDNPLLAPLKRERIVVEKGSIETVNDYFEEVEDALDAFLRKYLPADFEVDKYFPKAPQDNLEQYRKCLRSKLETVCKIWLDAIERYLSSHQEGVPIPAQPQGNPLGEGAWLFDYPDLFVKAMFDHLCMIVDAVIGHPIRGLDPHFLAKTVDRPPQKEHL